MSFRTRPVFSDRQIVQPSVETITLSGTTNFHGILKSKDVEIDATNTNAISGHTLTYNGTKIELFDSIGFNNNRYVRHDINNQPQLLTNPTNRLNARTNIQALSKDTDDSRTGSLTNTGNVDIIGNLKISNNSSLDNINLGETLNIGTSNSNVINIGNNNATVNIQGTVLYQNVEDLEVKDKLIRLNKGGSIGSGSSSGFEIEENNIVTGFLKTDGNRTGWILKSPGSEELNLGLNLLTQTRTQTFQNQNGTIALIGVGDLDDRYIRTIVTNNLSPLFTTSVSGTTPTETITFTLSNADANTFFGNNTPSNGQPQYNQLQALTRTNDTNVTLTLGGTPETSLAKPVSITVGWNGVLAVGRGGTGISSYTTGNYVRAANSTTLEQRTPSQVLSDISGVINTRLLRIKGTTNQVIVDNGSGNDNAVDLTEDREWTLTLPQNIHTGASPTFGGLTVNGNISLRASATTNVTTQIPVFTANPASTTRSIVTRTPSQLRGDIDAEQSFLKGNITTGINHPITITNGTGRLVGSSESVISHTASGWTNKTTLSGATVISNLSVDTFGHISNWTTRTLTLADLGYTGATNADNYGSWLLAATGTSGTQSITSGATATFSVSSPITVTRSSGTITYGHANSGVSAGTYNNVTVNAQGHVTGGSNVGYLTVVNLGYTEATTQGTVTNTGGSNAIIPAANASRAGLITTGTQTIAGNKTVNGTVTASNFITTSDKRLKSEIKPIENAIEILSKFTSYEYLKNNQKEAGFIAQEVKEYLPYTVFENEDGYLTMSDRPILAYLHKAVLDLKNDIDIIKSKLN